MDKTPVLTTCWTIKKGQNVEINRDKWISSFDKKKELKAPTLPRVASIMWSGGTAWQR